MKKIDKKIQRKFSQNKWENKKKKLISLIKWNRGYAAGKSYDNASEMCKQIGQTEEAANYLIKASEFYRLNNSQEKSAETLVKAAK